MLTLEFLANLPNGQHTEGDIFWADLDPTVGHEQAGRRPVLILSRPAFNDRSGTVVAVALTSAEPRAGFPLTLELTKTSLPKRTWVKIFEIRTILTQRLGGEACGLSSI